MFKYSYPSMLPNTVGFQSPAVEKMLLVPAGGVEALGLIVCIQGVVVVLRNLRVGYHIVLQSEFDFNSSSAMNQALHWAP